MRKGCVILMALVCQWVLFAAVDADAGRLLGTDLATWKPVDGEFKYIYGQERNSYSLKATLDAKYFDMFYGLPPGEERVRRIHLTGWWKLRRLPDTMTEPVWDAKAGRWRGGEELKKNDVGLKEKFWRPETDDSQWPWAFVPWNWNRQIGPRKGRGSYAVGGVGWYRRTFRLGDLAPGAKVIIHFEYVDKVSTVWVNGKEIGTYTVYETHPGGNLCRGNSAEQHKYDITDAIKPGADNQLTVRVFHNGLYRYKGATHGHGQTGGIWEPVWIDIVPPVYAEMIYVTPRLKSSSVSLKCSLRNTLGKSRNTRFRAVIKPWRSYRYTPPVQEAPSTSAALGKKNVPSGRSDVTFEVKLKRPVTWDHERPFLYHVQLYARLPGGLLGKEVLIGQARFGFREFKTDGAQFRINGKRIYLSGFQPNEPYRGSSTMAANNGDWALGWYERLKGANMIFMRWHSGHYPNPFFDTADESGYYICAERLLPLNYEDTPAYEASIKRLVDDYHNHPSVITYSMGNEHFSGGCGRQKILKTGPAFSKMYDLYKKYDQTRPITCCSGSAGITALKDDELDKWPKSDYHDNHDYTGGGWGHIAQIPMNMLRYRKAHARTDLSGTRPYVNGETIVVRPLKKRFFGDLGKGLPDIERKAYVDWLRKFTSPEARARRAHYAGWFISLVGLGTHLESIDAAVAESYRQIMEYYRIHGMEQVGFNLHAIGQEFAARPRPRESDKPAYTWHTIYNVLREKLQPVYAMCDGLNKNCFAGKPLSFRLVAVNDSLHDLENVRVEMSVVGGNAKAVGKTVSIPAFTQEKHHAFDVGIDLPNTLETGRYRLALALKDGLGKTLATNSYRLHVLGAEPPIGAAQTRKAVIYTGRKGQGAALKKVLEGLGVAYSETSDFNGLERFGVLIIGPLSYDDNARRQAYKIQHFLDNGGRALVLRQDSYEPDPISPGLTFHRFRRGTFTTTDVITLSHPVFRGMDRKDFHLWNGTLSPVTVTLMPLTPIALAATNPVSTALTDIGMAVGEVAWGKGVQMFSQLASVKHYETDSVAAHYTNNLIRYCVAGDWSNQYAVKPPAGSMREKFKRPDPKSVFFVNLRPHCNRSFTDDDPVADDRKGGWVDDGPKGDMRVMPLGKQTFIGVPFDIIDPAANKGGSCIVLGGRHKKYFPDRVENIKIGRKLSHLYFLIAPTWTRSSPGQKIGRIVFHYQWGGLGTTTVVAEQLVVGRNVLDWTKLSNNLPDAAIAFEKFHAVGNRHVGALIIPWENPFLEERIESISIISSGEAIPVIIAITGTTKVMEAETAK